MKKYDNQEILYCSAEAIVRSESVENKFIRPAL